MRNFENWETQDLEIAFNLEQLEVMDLLENWLQSTTELSISEDETIKKLKKALKNNADFWNEDELKLQFIAPIILIVDYTMPDYKIFSQRQISATINGIEIGGRVDFVLAKGKQKPIKPYFFIHEYKQETKKGSTDPKGQLLSEMLVAQAKNEGKMPVYGSYVLRRSWFFVILNGKEYAVSNAYNASDDDIYTVIAILRKVKEYVQNSERLQGLT
jgi:hypothetical protein